MTVIRILTSVACEREIVEQLASSLGDKIMGLENISKVIFVRMF